MTGLAGGPGDPSVVAVYYAGHWGAMQHPWAGQMPPLTNASSYTQRNSHRRGGKGASKAYASQTGRSGYQRGQNGQNRLPPGTWKTPDPGQGGDQHGGIRSEVLALRNAQNANARQNAVESLRTALLRAAHADEQLDGMLLGMAAAQCAKHGLSDLMGLLCAYASCRLENYGAREVAEMAAAATKLGCVECGFLRSVVAFCKKPAHGLFASTRDVGMVANALLHSLRQDAFRAARGNQDSMRSSINHEAGLLGLAEAAAANLQSGVPVRDLAELAHVFGHALEVQPNGEKLYEKPSVRKVIRIAIELFRGGVHMASARDATMTAGAMAAAWPYMEPEREEVFGPCLVDIAQFARFRRSDFNPQDLSLLALAFSKAGVATDELIEVLNEQVVARIAEFSNKDLVLLLDASARIDSWIHSNFLKTAAAAVSHCRLTEFAAQDLSSLAQSLAMFGAAGKEPLQRIAGEAFRRQLCSFSSKDKAFLLWALAKAQSKEAALIRILVRALGIEDCTILDKDTLGSTLWALARIWAQLPEGDHLSALFLRSVCSTCPWNEATGSKLSDMAWAIGQLSAQLETDVWGSFLAEVEKLAPNTCTVHELCFVLSGLSRSPSSHWYFQEGLAERILAEMDKKLKSDPTTLRAGDARLLREAVDHGKWSLPSELAEIISTGDILADSDSQEDGMSASADHVETASEDAHWTSPTPWSSEDEKVPETADDQIVFGEEEVDYDIPPKPKSSEHDQGLRSYQRRHEDCSPPPAPCEHNGVQAWLGEEQDSVLGQGSISQAFGPNCPGCDKPSKSGRSPTRATSQRSGHADARGSSSFNDEDYIDSDQMTAASSHTEGQASHGLQGGKACEKECCPTIYETSLGHVHLNAHCDFQGHCIQIKNTFVHLSCDHGPESEGTDCMVCKMTRARSLDDVRTRGGDSVEGFFENLGRKAESQRHVPHRGGRLAIGDASARREDSREMRGRKGRREVKANAVAFQ